MIIFVQLHEFFQGQAPDMRQRPFEVMMLSGSSLADLVSDLGLDLSLEAIHFEVNGRVTGPDTILQDWDQINLMPGNSENMP